MNNPTTYPCSRCGGTGRFSFNLMHGTRCYGCSGTGRQKTKPRDPTPHWAVFGHCRQTGESRRLYNVRAKTEAGAIQAARGTFSRASTAFKDENTLANARAIKFSDMKDPCALTIEAALQQPTDQEKE